MKKNRNFGGFIWHAFWLALAETFAEKNTVLPGLILLAGGSQLDIGILTSIMIGIPLLTQLIFAGYLTNKPLKKPFMIGGILLRVFAFFGVGISIFLFESLSPKYFIYMIFFWMLLFTISGAFAGVSYTDIVGKSFNSDERKEFFVIRQFLSGAGILISAILVRQLLVTIAYPTNYQAAFFTASGLLFIASLGFLFLKERPSEISQKYRSIIQVIRKIPEEIRKNPNLKYYVLASNLVGASLVLVPFYIAFIQTNYPLTNYTIGNFLLSQIIGMIFSNILWHKMVKIISFKGMLKIAALLLSLLPVLVLLLNLFGSITYFYLLFVFSGAAISALKIAQEGIIIEISNESNRPLYIGIFGTLNLTAAVVPLFLGLLLEYINYSIIFVLLSLVSLYSLRLIGKMICPIDLNKA